MNARELMAALGQAAGIEPPEPDEFNSVHFETKDGKTALDAEASEDGTVLQVVAHVGRLPEQAGEAAGVLLAMNSALIPLGRGAFALEGDKADRVILMQRFETAAVTEDLFISKVEELIKDATEWNERLALPDFGLDGEDLPDTAPFNGMCV